MTSSVADRTLELLWSRIRQRGNLPGFSKVVSAVLGAMRGDDDREFSMTKTVLSDPALTQRVLRLANSAMYSVFGQGINTVSKAVIVLGTESIGHLALGLKLIDGLSSASSDSDSARDEMEKAVFAGHIARQVTATASARDVEEAVVCSMLHSLGRMMTAFYLPDQWAIIQAQTAATGEEESEVAQHVLGIGLVELGRCIAERWGLPAELVRTMHDFPPKEVGEPLNHEEWLAAVSTMSSSCAQILCNDGPTAAADISMIAANYADMLGMETAQLMAAVEGAKSTASEEAVFNRPRKALGVGNPAIAAIPISPTGKPPDAAVLLARGASDMRGALAAASSAQMVAMALETVFKGLGLSRAVAFFRNQEQAQYQARLCFGEGMQDLLPRLIFSDAYQPDVFHAALANDKMIFIENAKAPAFVAKLPRWWRDNLPSARSFLVLPVTINRKPVGFIYGDWDESLPPSKIAPGEVPPLDEIRAMVATAIEQRHRHDPPWMV
ncbi:MAG: HDOD domain-containing protein [Herminiimonas sp.]|nr:HDOD domain-containing protein [Herminiimonas sp.]